MKHVVDLTVLISLVSLIFYLIRLGYVHQASVGLICLITFNQTFLIRMYVNPYESRRH